MTPDKLLEEDSDSEIIDEAKERFKYALAWESDARSNWIDDYKFANGDSENLYQWPEDIVSSLDRDSLPHLTINKVRQHNLQIINDAKQNKPSIRYRPVSDEASVQAAEVYEGLVRHIEYQSKATVAYDTATAFQVQAGLGYLRVETDWAGDDTFDQEIYIRRVRDPLTILLDPDAKEADYSDGRFAFVFEDVPRDQFNMTYPEYKDMPNLSAFGGATEDWVNNDKVRVAEYWRRKEVEDELMLYVVPETGQQQYARKSEIPAELYKQVKQDPTTKTRPIVRSVVQHFFLVGDTVAKREAWAGQYIPIVPVIGEETIIERVLDRKGHTRAMKDPQRMYNYHSSSATAQMALQTKTPYVAPAQAIEGYESYWENANNTSLAVLPYNNRDDDGNEIAPPQRQTGPIVAQAYLQAMQFTSQELMDVSGQHQAQLGQPSNERTGKAIAERQRQGDTATYHFIDNLAIAIRQVGRIILDLIPKIYDQKRVLRILGEDGDERQVLLDPQAKAAYQKQQMRDSQTAMEIFNPNVGKYDVQADIGPAYSTQRQEAWNAFVQIVTQAPQLMQIIGDLLFKVADFPLADEISERLKRTIDPGLLGEGLPPAIQQLAQQAQQQIQMLMQQNQQLRAQLEGAAAKLTQKDLQLTSEDQRRIIDAYKAETDRMKALGPVMDPQALAQLAAQLVLDALKVPMGEATQAAVSDLTQSVGSFGAPGYDDGRALAQAAGVPAPLGPSAGTGGVSSTAAAARAALAPPGTPLNGPPLPQQGGQPMPPGNGSGLPPGARLAQDGQHYVPDPNNPGKHLLVVNS